MKKKKKGRKEKGWEEYGRETATRERETSHGLQGLKHFLVLYSKSLLTSVLANWVRRNLKFTEL